jgi:hypothetical protein
MTSQNPPWPRLGVLAAGLSLVALLGFAGTAEAQQKRPNVVMLMTDDTGWNDFGAYGGGVDHGLCRDDMVGSETRDEHD